MILAGPVALKRRRLHVNEAPQRQHAPATDRDNTESAKSATTMDRRADPDLTRFDCVRPRDASACTRVGAAPAGAPAGTPESRQAGCVISRQRSTQREDTREQRMASKLAACPPAPDAPETVAILDCSPPHCVCTDKAGDEPIGNRSRIRRTYRLRLASP